MIDRWVGAESKRWLVPGALALLGAVLFLPGLGAFGLWDPSEVRLADLAKGIATSGSWGSVGHPPLTLWAIALGFKLIGVSDVGGRLPIAVASILALLACWYAATALLGRRGALFSTVALVTMPIFFLGARQLTTDVMPLLASALAVGGLARAAWPAASENDGRRILHAIVGLVGLGLGHLAVGTMLGVLIPLGGLAIGLLLGGGPVGSTVAAVIATLAALGATIAAWAVSLTSHVHGGYSPILGGAAHPSVMQVTLTNVIKQIGFGAFPWVALLPLAAARAWGGDDEAAADDADARRRRFGRLALVAWVMVAYVVATLYHASVGDVLFPGFVAVALLAGDYLDQILDVDARLGYAGFVALVGVVVIGHDFVMQPESYVGAHVLEGIKWPGPVTLPPLLIFGFGMAWALLVIAAHARKPVEERYVGREGLVLGAVVVALGLTGVTLVQIVPEVAQHLSSKGLFKKYQQLGGGEMAQYHVHTSAYETKGKPVELQTLPQLFDFLGKPTRVFAMVSADDLAPIDQYAKQRTQASTAPGAGNEPPAPATYYVVDDSSSRILLLSNQLGAGEPDLNPLKRLIVARLPRNPQHEVHADFEGKVELVGYDLPPELDRGRDFKVTLYYKVNQPLPAAYKVFLHFDGPGNRFNGDHVPLDGKFPTNYWVPGFYIIDEHEMSPDRATTPSGWYQIYTGFWLGDSRLKVVAGNNDGENRVKIGTVRVK